MTILRIAIILVWCGAGAVWDDSCTVSAFVPSLGSLRSLDVPFMAPVAPVRPHNPDILLRLPVWMQKRLLFLAKRDAGCRKEDGK